MGSTDRDAMGCYPVFSCRNWRGLAADFDAIGDEWVSLVVVTDPFAEMTEAELWLPFRDLVREYKAHFVVDLARPPGEFVSAHHLRNALTARRAVAVRTGPPTSELLETWVALYGNLIARHQIRGFAAFSGSSFECQFRVPGLIVQWAEMDGAVVGMVLWYVSDDRAYYHLGAYSEAGYAVKCSFALFLDAIERFPATGVRWLALGAGAGAVNDGSDGLTRFKRGWATTTRMTYLCGRVFDTCRYRAACVAKGVPPDAGYFPAYRAGEFR